MLVYWCATAENVGPAPGRQMRQACFIIMVLIHREYSKLYNIDQQQYKINLLKIKYVHKNMYTKIGTE